MSEAKYIITVDTIISTSDVLCVRSDQGGDAITIITRCGREIRSSLPTGNPNDIPRGLLLAFAQLEPDMIAASGSWLRQALGIPSADLDS